MRYIKFEINNFKGIKKLELDLTRKNYSNISVLVGLNESGKTTILEAIHWFYSSSYDSDNNYIYDLIPKDKRANFNGRISVKSTIELNSVDEDEIEKFSKKRGYVLSEKIGKIVVEKYYLFQDSEFITKKSNWTINLIGKKGVRGTKDYRIYDEANDVWNKIVDFIKEKIFPPVVFYENFLFDFPDRIYINPEVAPPENNAYLNVIQDVLNSLDSGLRIDKHLLKRFEKGKSKDLDNISAVLDMASAKITDVVIKGWKEILNSEDSQIEISLGNSIENDVDDTFGPYIQVKVKENTRSYLIKERSLGFRWFFAFILFTFFRIFREDQQQLALFLLDEPASNLHPSAQTKLLSEFQKIIENQLIIYSTHSHHLINPDWLSGTFIVRNKGINYSRLNTSYNQKLTEVVAQHYYQFAGQHPNQTDYYRPILDALDVKPSPLDYPTKVIILEGRNDFYTMKYMADMKFVDTSVSSFLYPGGGADKIIHYVTLMISLNKKFVVLLDDDKKGRKTKKKIIDEFGVIVEKSIFTFNDVDKSLSGFLMEDIFAYTDDMKIIKEVNPELEDFQKSWFNAGIEKCWQERINADLTKSTIDRFQKIFDFLENNL